MRPFGRYSEWVPTIAEVSRELKAINEMPIEPEDEEEGLGIDVRLQVVEGEGWQVWFGDAGYDTDHRGHWGASSVPGGAQDFSARDVAKDLIDQVIESAMGPAT